MRALALDGHIRPVVDNASDLPRYGCHYPDTALTEPVAHRCSNCDEPTGCAGPEDFMFAPDDVEGEFPLCEACVEPCGRCGRLACEHPAQMCMGRQGA